MNSLSAIKTGNAYWRSISIFNLYRIIISVVFIGSYWAVSDHSQWENFNSTLYLQLSIAYFVFSLLAIGSAWIKWPSFDRQVIQQTSLDILFIVALMFAAGGIKSGIGLLLVIAIIAASLISEGRLALFYASVASVALLLEQSYQLISWPQHYDEYSHAVMLCISCFATAWLAHTFAKRTLQSEALATQREIDLESLAQINELITQEMHDGVIVVDQHHVVRHHNSQAETLLNMSGKTWKAHSLATTSPALDFLLNQWIRKRNEDTENAVKFVWHSRESRVRFMPIGEDRQSGAVIFIEDWSQMQAQAQQLKLAALGRLTANIAHEIRNPLSAISHANQLLQEDIVKDPVSQRLLQIIADNVDRVDQMIKDVLELNRRDRTQQQRINLSEFIRDFHHDFCEIEKVPDTSFIIEIPDEDIYINFDKRHMHQVLWNLCRNAWRHSTKSTNSIQLRLVNEGMYVSAEIHDDGAGVAEANISHLFEPFFTTESTGTGLGLYIARELCEANSASLEYSDATQHGLFILKIKKAETA